jgi:hypothetical protein
MKCGRRPAVVELAVAMDSLARRQSLDLDTPLPELLNRLRVGPHLSIRARAHNEALRQLIDDLAEVGKDEAVPIGPPPIGKNALGQDDYVTRLFLTVDEETTEVVALDPRHRLTSDHRFVLSIPCPGCTTRNPDMTYSGHVLRLRGLFVFSRARVNKKKRDSRRH